MTLSTVTGGLLGVAGPAGKQWRRLAALPGWTWDLRGGARRT